MDGSDHLRLVDTQTGEIGDCPGCAKLLGLVEGHEHTIRSQSATISRLKRDREREALNNPLWPTGERLFEIWRHAAGKTKRKGKQATFSVARFEVVEPFVRRDNGFELCAKAILGRCFDHYASTRANGSTIRYYEWTRIFASDDEFEESASRIPLAPDATFYKAGGEVVGDWRARLEAWDPGPMAYPKAVESA